MSTQHPEGQPSGEPFRPAPPPPQYPAGSPYAGPDLQRRRTNVMAILGLVFAFVFSPLGIVFSLIGLSQIKKRQESGKGLAIAGLVLSILSLLIGVLILLFVLPAAVKDARQQANADAASAHGIVASCAVIVPALTQSDADLTNASTTEDFRRLTATLGSRIAAAAHTATDPVFVQDVLTLSQDFQRAAELPAGADPSALQQAFDADGQVVSDDCAAAGYAG